MNLSADDTVAVSLPVPTVSLRSGRRAHCLAIVQAPILIERLIVPSACAEKLLLHDVRIENISQFAAAACDGVPANVFSEMAVGLGLSWRAMTSGCIVDLIFENTSNEPAPLTFALMGRMRKGETFEPAQPPADGRYHTWVKRRQWIYESLFRSENDDVFFNGHEILSDTFMPCTALWWVDDDGWKNRPVYTFEKVALGDKRGNLQVVNIDTYEGFDGA